MKKMLKTILYILFALVLLALCWLGNEFFGNPVSYLMARGTARAHLAQTYPGTDYYIDRMVYNFKSPGYQADVRSPSSIDTRFTLHISRTGKLKLDTYDSVLNGYRTAERLEREYHVLTSQILDGSDFPYDVHIGYGTLEIHPEEAFQETSLSVYDLPPYAINQNELVLDKIYDIREMGRQAGHLVIYIDSGAVDVQQAAVLMLDIKNRFDAAGVPFAAMSFVLQYPRPHQGQRPEGAVRVAHFLYEDIYEDGMAERVAQADKALSKYYARMDGMDQ